MEIEEIHKLFLDSTGVNTDTRNELGGKMFFALKGPNFNGNEYAEFALDNGGMCAVIDESEFCLDSRYIVVDNVLLTLQSLAHYHRSSLSIPVLGITGTNGKTTSKELISIVLSEKYNVYATKGNFNNHIGVPLSLLELNQKHEFAIIEMGANKLGDIKELCKIADPNYGLITNIGIAHLEGFKTKTVIKKEKSELFKHIKNKQGYFFVNENEEDVCAISKGYERNILIGDSSNSDFQFELEFSIPFVKMKYIAEAAALSIDSELYGEHNYENIKVAAGIGLYFGVKPSQIQKAIKSYHASNNRSQLVRNGDMMIFMDAYNANPSSMEVSIRSFSEFDHPHKVIIIGSMLELGIESKKMHRLLVDQILQHNWDSIILIGAEFEVSENGAPNLYQYKKRQDADSQHDWKKIPKDAFILIKGSRGQALEKLDFIKRLL